MQPMLPAPLHSLAPALPTPPISTSQELLGSQEQLLGDPSKASGSVL